MITDISDKPVETPPVGFVPTVTQQNLLRDELRAAGVEMGEYDETIVVWLAHLDWSTVAPIAGWIRRSGRSTAPVPVGKDA